MTKNSQYITYNDSVINRGYGGAKKRRKILFSTRENDIHIFKLPFNVLFIQLI